MAKNFKEIVRKAENLIEQGKESDQEVQNCQMMVASFNDKVMAARRQLAAASETDEEGNPVGDVAQARAQLSMAENQLAASERALSTAQREAKHIKAQKNTHVREIEGHNRIERSNLDKLKQLKTSAFGENSTALTEGIALRLNEAEEAKAELLRSMGIDASPEHVTVEGGGDSGHEWNLGNFGSLDTTGNTQSYRGGGSEGFVNGSGLSTPVGGGFAGFGNDVFSGNTKMNTEKVSSVQTTHKSYLTSKESRIDSIIGDIQSGSGETISRERAEAIHKSLRNYSGSLHRKIREAYNNPSADSYFLSQMNDLDEYINKSPKWQGEVYRGINVDSSTAEKILQCTTIDMLGPSSWSSDEHVADGFADRVRGTRLVFILNNKSGASITHLSTFGSYEREVIAPSGVQYIKDNVEERVISGKKYIYVHVHEER